MIVDMSPGHRISPSKGGATWQVTSPKAPFQKKRRLRGCVCRSEEHTSELQSLMRISYAVFCLTKNNNTSNYTTIKYIPLNKQITTHTSNVTSYSHHMNTI